jgi:CubicO group peptidase (beta-lactamase class C family)
VPVPATRDPFDRRRCGPSHRARRTGIAGIAALAAALTAWSGCAKPPGAATGRGDVAARVDSMVATYLKRTYVPGVSVAVIRGGRDTLVFRGYGVANLEHGVPATAETVYPIASITKQFTADAVMQLAEQKRLALDDSIGRFLPELPPAWRRVRVRQLLNHPSGVPDHAVLLREDLAPDSVVALAARDPFEFAPGTQWRYNNVGYLVLGLIVEKASGEPYARYLQTRIFQPLGLKATRYCDPELLTPHRAAGYVQRDTGVANAPYTSMVALFGAGAICSTAGDLAAWNHALAQGRVVSPASWARMTTSEGAARAHGYGYGLSVAPFEGHRLVGQGGQFAGFKVSSAYLPDDSLSVTVLTNLGSERGDDDPAASPDKLLLDIVRVLAPSRR